MSYENKKTLEVYERCAAIYLDNANKHDNLDMVKAKKKKEKLERFIKDSFSSLPIGSKILEIGSADGGNALYLKSLGYDVTASDVSDIFLEKIKNQGLRTIKFDCLEDEFKEKYNGIFCWRVFVHFSCDDVMNLLEKVYESLEDNGIFIFNAMNRKTHDVDSEWVDFEGEYHMGEKRFYNYFRKEKLDDLISKTNFKIDKFFYEGGSSNNKWLVYVLKK